MPLQNKSFRVYMRIVTKNGLLFEDAKSASLTLGVSADYVSKLARSGVIPSLMVRGSWFVDSSSLTHYLSHKRSQRDVSRRALSIASRRKPVQTQGAPIAISDHPAIILIAPRIDTVPPSKNTSRLYFYIGTLSILGVLTFFFVHNSTTSLWAQRESVSAAAAVVGTTHTVKSFPGSTERARAQVPAISRDAYFEPLVSATSTTSE